MVSDNAPSGVGIFSCDGFNALYIIFGGTDAADETINFQVLGYRNTAGPATGGTDYVPQIVAKGTATLGTMTYDTTDLGAAANLFADTIVTTIAYGVTHVYSPADNTVARLIADVAEFSHFKVEVDRGTAATSDVFFDGTTVLPANQVVNIDVPALNIGNVGLLDVNENEIDPSGGGISNIAAAAGQMLAATGVVRKDTPALPEAVADGDWVAAQANALGEMRVTDDNLRVGSTAPVVDSYTTVAVDLAA
ncbi:hypothetical protein LCGC14_3059320, partial [marine sediment metagenome]